jgi:hypothetical protein
VLGKAVQLDKLIVQKTVLIFLKIFGVNWSVEKVLFFEFALSNAFHGDRRFVRHIGLRHFAYLRAVAEGLDVADCAMRYLGTEHGHETRSALMRACTVERSDDEQPRPLMHNRRSRMTACEVSTMG